MRHWKTIVDMFLIVMVSARSIFGQHIILMFGSFSICYSERSTQMNYAVTSYNVLAFIR